MSSIRWIRNLTLDGVPLTFEIMIGSDHIADKCYVRVNAEPEFYFKAESDTRQAIVRKGIEILKQRFEGKEIKTPGGEIYDWT